MRYVIHYISLLVLLASVAWLALDPGWEPTVSTLVSLGAFLGSDLYEFRKSQQVLPQATAEAKMHEELVLSDRLVYLLRHMALAPGGLYPSSFGKALAEWEYRDKGRAYANLSPQGRAGWDKASGYACRLFVSSGLAKQTDSEVLISQAGRDLLDSIKRDYPKAFSVDLIPLW